MPRVQRPDKHRGPEVNTTARYVRDRDPTNADYRCPENNEYYEICTLWVNSTDNDPWILVDITANSATWVPFGFAEAVLGTLTGDDGVVVSPDPAKNIDLLGVTVANATNSQPLWTNGDIAAFKLDFELQVGCDRTGSPGNVNDAGVVSFDDTVFVTDADGYTTLIGGKPAALTITGDDSDPVGPDGAGNIDWQGSTVANATNAKPLYMNGTSGSNLMEPEIQLAIATSKPADSNDAGICSFIADHFDVDANGSVDVELSTESATPDASDLAGICYFDSAQFDVNAFGWVSLIGGKPATLTITGDDADAVGPDGDGNIDWQGSTVANATNAKPLYMNGTSGSNIMEPEIQVTVAIGAAPGDKLDAGIASFDSDDFTVTEHGFVGIRGSSPGGIHVIEDYLHRGENGAASAYEIPVQSAPNLDLNFGEEDGHPGVIKSTGNAGIGMIIASDKLTRGDPDDNPHCYRLGSGEITYRTWFKHDAFDAAGEKWSLGFSDSNVGTTGPAPTLYARFYGVHGTANIYAQTYDGTETSTDTSVPLDTDWHLYEIVVNSDGSSSQFNIDGAGVATITTHIPTGVPISVGNLADNSTTNRFFYTDLIEAIYTPTGDRA